MKRIWDRASDHFVRCRKALDGFELFGARWLRPWLYFAFLPILKRIGLRKILRFDTFAADITRCDLETFGGAFLDYPISALRPALPNIQTVIDAGANAGAFSWLIDSILNRTGILKVIAVEPDLEMCRFIENQPFSKRIEIKHGALGPDKGLCKIRKGANSVSHTIEILKAGQEVTDNQSQIPVYSVESLCMGATLLKMDIEGGEHLILSRPIPTNVHYMVIEWHPEKRSSGWANPNAYVAQGTWRCLSRDPFGLSTWFWERRE